ncbi:Sensor protein TorS [Pandoraea iniqua]|uniref:ATP-binding response regulator n=1 Tax=Pandoraea iniqua TaxID=2508288 RepID=UPI00124080E7|nr:hybrid sensor histidine kinase/response regulator [Pandoraea iniqua]VVE15719.1 Sensor protein TorS [Pandoraea iniqua]
MTLNNLPNDDLDGCRDDAVMRTESAATEIDAGRVPLPSLAGEGGLDMADTFRLALVHELRAPLQVLQGQLDALTGVGSAGGAAASGDVRAAGQAPERDRVGRRARFDTMREALDVLVRVVDDVLHLGQGDAVALPLLDEPFEVRAQLDGEVALFAPEARAKGLALSCDIDDDVPVMLRGDAVRLRQIVRTLLANALKYTAAGEVCVWASWQAPANHLTVRVTDTGPGIPEGAREAVFSAFFRGHPAIPGTGLGLWIARRWAHRMGGALFAETPVRGAHFRLSLPLQPLAASSMRTDASDRADALIGADRAASTAVVVVRDGLRVLVVDDHPINRLVLCEQLTSLGCVTEGVSDAAAALAHWAACDVDVVLTDVQLGQVCGLTLASDVLQLAMALRRRAPVVIAVTGSLLDARMARDAGIDAVLPKPVSRRRLQQVLAARWPRLEGAGHEAGSSPAGGVVSPAPLAQQVSQGPQVMQGAQVMRRNPKLPLYKDAGARGLMRREMANDIAQFRRLLRRRHEGDLMAAQAVLHRMQGACRMFGDPELLARCAALAAKLAAVAPISRDI